MAVEVIALTDLSSNAVQQVQTELAQLMQELNPSIDTRRGVLFELLFYNEAIFAEKNNKEIDRLQRSQSLLSALADPELAEDAILDAAASNFRATRKAGSAASGSITIIVDTLAPVTIAVNTVWEASGLEFTNAVAFSAVTAAGNVTSSTDRVLSPVGDGTFSFSIDLVAAETGAAGALSKGALFIPQTVPTNFVKAFASADFTGGLDAESNTALLGRLITGVSCKALSGTTAMDAALRDVTAFVDVLNTSIIGFGDGEMIRDQHTIFPSSMGGRVDWYIRSQEKAQLSGLVKTATLIQKTTDLTGIWQFGLTRDDFPGFLDVSKIVPKGNTTASGFGITSDVRSRDMTVIDNDGFLPDINSDLEAVYSRFQAGVIQFEDNITNVSALVEGSSTADYDVTVRGFPLIEEIQDWASARSIRNKAGDALIKAPVPCFIEVSFTIQLRPGSTTPTTSTIANNVAQLINRYGFTGKLPASAIIDVVHNSLSGIAYISDMDILGTIRRPNGTFRRIRTSDVLEIPDEPANMVTARTVAFIADPSDIAISVIFADIPEI